MFNSHIRWGFISLLFVSVAQIAMAVPVLDRHEGVVSNGNTVVVFGNGFGSKVPAAPFRYDNFYDGVPGDKLKSQASGGWYTIGVVAPVYTKDNPRIPGETLVLQDYLGAGYYNREIGLWNIDASRIYMSGWCYRDDYMGTAHLSSNQKLWGNFGTGDGTAGDGGLPQCRFDSAFTLDTAHLGVADCDATASHLAPSDWTGDGHGFFGEWFRLERYVNIGTRGQANGRSWVAKDLNKLAETSGVFYTCGDPYNYWVIGQFFRTTEDNGDQPRLRVYWSELYVDMTPARIEVGDHREWARCTHREIQIPVAWSGETVEFTVNRGSFEPGSTAWVFVVDEAGVPAEFGLEVTFDTTVDWTSPGMPRNASIDGP